MRERLAGALDRAHPGVVIGAGLAVVALVFGALGLAILRDREPGLDDLGLRAPEAPAAADDFGESGTGDGASADGGSPLADGLAERAGTGRASDGADGGTGGSDAPAAGASGASSAPGGGASPAAPSEHQPSTTVGRSQGTTTTAPSTTTSPPPSTTTTTVAEEPEPHPGLIGGLLDVLGVGG